MVDVVRSNFLELLPKIREEIRKCDFTAIDCEFTGIGTGNSFFDTLDERYGKIRNSMSNYLLIQFGLSCFTKVPGEEDGEEESYACSNYNFFIFPYKVPGAVTHRDRNFLCSSSALSFLSSHDFNFNKWIREGISFMHVEEEAKLVEALKGKNVTVNTTSTDLDATLRSLNESSFQLVNTHHIPDEHKEFMDKFMSGLNDFFNDDSRKTWKTEPCSSFRRKLIFQSVKSLNVDNLKCTSCPVAERSPDRYISIEKISSEQKAHEIQKIIDEASGFTRIIEELIESKKPIVGHNLLLDMLLTVSHFIGPLPDTLAEFKEILSNLFPYTYDTKLMATLDSKLASKISNTTLDDIYSVVRKSPFPNVDVKIINGVEGGDKSSFHNAGYDSFVTGVVFLNLARYLNPRSSGNISEFSELKKFQGKYNITFIFDITYLDINQSVQESDRIKVFHLTFPSTWTKSHIYDLLSPFRPGQIGWINDTSALVVLEDVSNDKDIDRVLTSQRMTSSYTIKTYRSFMDEKCSPALSGKRKLDLVEDDKTIETSTPVVVKKPKIGGDLTQNHGASKIRKIFDDDADQW